MGRTRVPDFKRFFELILRSFERKEEHIYKLITFIESHKEKPFFIRDLEEVKKHLWLVLKPGDALVYPVVLNFSSDSTEIRPSPVSFLMGIFKGSNLKVGFLPMDLQFTHFYALMHELIRLRSKLVFGETKIISLNDIFCLDLNQYSPQHAAVFELIKEFVSRSSIREAELQSIPLLVVNKEIGPRILEFLDFLSQGERIKTIYFSVMGELSMMPLHTIYDGQKFLIEKMPVMYVSSMRKLEQIEADNIICIDVDLGYPGSEQRECEVVIDSLKKGNFDGRVEVVTDPGISQFEKAISDKTFNTVHISTHGTVKIENHKTLSYIKLADGNHNTEILSRMNFRADLLILSACSLQFSYIESFDSIYSPAYILGSYGRINKAISSLSLIHEHTTKAFFKEFYKYWPHTEFELSVQQGFKRLIAEGYKDWLYIFPLKFGL